MTVEEIKDLIHVVNESGIAELEVQRGENRVRIKRSYTPHPQEILLTPGPSVVSAAPAASQVLAASSASQITAASAEDASTVPVKSPIVGTFFESPSPGAPPFVKVGDRVGVGQVLCIIESMKLMNEIEAEVAGTITSRLVENGNPVEYGQVLFAVKPA
ncbi:MAG TPA: acetyl-CoA carboxylase biotin carboxyl carrier protein [Bryobacteraceae bacterium]|nr:acetyl-CoA carboxylase biotin carboxyl carrier protein [Bryobacteraceae bacterium]